MNKLLVATLAAALMLAACQNEPRQRPDLSDVASTPTGNAQYRTDPDDPNIVYNISPTAAPPVVGKVGLVAGSGEVAAGATICVPVTTQGFTDVVSTQYSLKWNPAVLQYQELKEFNLRNFGKNNYGAHRAKEGVLTVVWIDETLKGVTLQESTPLYKICFKAVGNAGASSTLRFDNTPTPYEVVTTQLNLLELVPTEGRVVVK